LIAFYLPSIKNTEDFKIKPFFLEDMLMYGFPLRHKFKVYVDIL